MLGVVSRRRCCAPLRLEEEKKTEKVKNALGRVKSEALRPTEIEGGKKQKK